MKKRRTLLVAAVLIAGALVLVGLYPAAPVEAGGECGSCTGSTRTASGSARASSCSEALGLAYLDALGQAWSGAPACSPCQIATTSQNCSIYDCYPGPCPGGSYGATWNLSFKCESCSPGGPLTPGL